MTFARPVSGRWPPHLTSGSVKVKAEPLPSMEDTLMVPPCALTSSCKAWAAAGLPQYAVWVREKREEPCKSSGKHGSAGASRATAALRRSVPNPSAVTYCVALSRPSITAAYVQACTQLRTHRRLTTQPEFHVLPCPALPNPQTTSTSQAPSLPPYCI